MVLFFEPEMINDGIYDFSNGTAYDFDTVVLSSRMGTAIWNGSTRTMWSIGVGLLIILCHCGAGFIINDFLSCQIFTVLAKLTYLVYLIHIPLILMWESYMNGEKVALKIKVFFYFFHHQKAKCL